MNVLLDWGCGHRRHPGAIGVDNVRLESVQVVSDLLYPPYPFSEGCADEIILSHVLEHFSFAEINTILGEAYRILSPDGVVTISVPHALSIAFHSDPTHKTRFTFETFFYFTQGHRFSYYRQIEPLWKINRLWASVNLFNDLHAPARTWQQRLERFTSRGMSYVVRHSRTMTMPDLIVRQFPFWLVSVHCQLVKANPGEASR